MSRIRKKPSYGLSTLEFVIAAVVMSITLIPMIASLINLRQGTEHRSLEISAIVHGQNLADSIRQKKWDELSPSKEVYIATPSGSLSSDMNEPNLSFYDDVDDYNGYVDKPLPTISRSVNVSYCSLNVDGTISPSGSPTNYKKVVVTTTHASVPSKPKSISIVFVNGVD